jgi:hypothetical protein
LPRFASNALIRVTSDGLKGSRGPTLRPLFQGTRLLFFFLANVFSSVRDGRYIVCITGVIVGSSTKIHKPADDDFYFTLLQAEIVIYR